MSPSPVLAVTMGDPAGIGPDLALAAWVASAANTARGHDQGSAAAGALLPPFALHADPALMAERAAALGLRVPLDIITSPTEAREVWPGALPVLPVRLRTRCQPGIPDSANASAVISAIERATAAVAEGQAAAVVTLPISKSVLYHAGFRHPGHTEFLAALAEHHWPGSRHRPVMMLASDELRVVPATIHIPLAKVPGALSERLIVDTVEILHADLIRRFAIMRPRIAVSGLNPHAGEDGSLGREEIDIIAPAIRRLRSLGLDVSGPHSADTMFHARAREGYDAAVAMYHDQALIPIKTLAFDTGVNVTLGLPFIRTSPDHGTAFDIAGRGLARPDSFLSALRLAARMAATEAAGATATAAGRAP